MIMAAVSERPLSVKTLDQYGESATHWPAITTKITSATPMMDASRTRPGRTKRRYTPSSRAMGIVMANVKVAQGDDFNAFTTTRAITAKRMTMIARTASCAMNPPRSLTSSRAIWPRDFPSRRIEQNRITKSWTQPPNAAPTISHNVPGR